MLFVLDETGLRIDGDEGANVAVGRLVGVLEAAREERQRRMRLADLYTYEVAPDLPLHQFLFGETPAELDIPVDVRRLLQIALDRCTVWDDEFDIEALEADYGVGGVFAPSVAFAHGCITRGEAVACVVTASAGRRGPVDVTVQGSACAVYFVVESDDRIAFYRSAFEVEDADETEYWRIARLAYPDLEYVNGLDQQWRRFSRGYREMRPLVTWHLSALNDYHRQAFNGHPVPNEIAARMSAWSGGVDMSPESPGTRGNARAWRERRIVWQGHVLYCEWHMKISRTIDRIHFHPGIEESGGRPVIGLLVDHLST